MKGRLGIPAVLAVVAVMFLASPAVSYGAEDAEASFYESQLDENGMSVYSELGDLHGTYTNIISVSVDFRDIVLFEDEAAASAYGVQVADDAMAARYYTDPTLVYLWDLPVTDVEVKVVTSQVTVSSGSVQEVYYIASSVSFQLEVPEDMRDDPATEANELQERMAELDKAIADIKIEGSVPDAARSVADSLRKVKSVGDEEGKVSNAYDALVDKKSSAAGISAAYTAIATANGLDAITVKGDLWMPGTEEPAATYWNAVCYEGGWYAVDVSENNRGSSGMVMAGTASEVVCDGVTSTFGVMHAASLDLSSENTLTAPDLVRDAYPYPVYVPFLDKYGSQIMMLIIGAVIVGTLVYAVKKGNL